MAAGAVARTITPIKQPTMQIMSIIKIASPRIKKASKAAQKGPVFIMIFARKIGNNLHPKRMPEKVTRPVKDLVTSGPICSHLNPKQF